MKTEPFISRSSAPEGSTPYVSSFSTNNGVKNFLEIDPKENNLYSNFVSISTRGSIGKCFYQESPAVISNGVAALFNRNLNRYNGLFLATVFRNTIEQTLWHRQNIKSSLRGQVVTLPVDETGNVNWDFMEEYIRSIPNSNLLQKVM